MTGNQIDRTFVVRRALNGMPFRRDILAHSGLLLLTRNGKYFLVERLVGDDSVGFQEVDIIVNEALDSHQVITMAGMTWTKQARGSAVTRLCDVDEVRAFLLTYTQNFAYDPRNHNCHSAQEELRRWLGQSVPEDRPFTTFTRTLASWVPASIAKSRLPD